MTTRLALLLSLTALTMAGCDTADDSSFSPYPEDLSTERTGSGCTHSQEYWRTHNKYGEGDKYKPWHTATKAYAWFDWHEGSPALYADVDDQVCPDRGTYFDVLMATPDGDRWILLAHKYIVAKLNLTSGAATAQGWDLVIEAREMLGDCQIDASEWEDSLDLAADLHGYNTGDWGPGACTE